MRIYMIGAKGFPATQVLGSGGIERHVEEVATRLAARGHQVFVYVRAHSADPARKSFCGVNIVRLPSFRSKNLGTISHVLLATLHVLFQSADIVHYHGVGPATLSIVPRLFKWSTRTVVTFHSRDRFDPKWSRFARMYLAYGEWAATHFPHVTLVTSHVLQVYCRKMFHRETTYFPNGATIPRRVGSEVLASFCLTSGDYFLCVGRLVPNKAYDVAIEAFSKSTTSKKLVIVGDAVYADAYVERLEHLASKDGRVKLVGYQTGAALAQLYAHCYAFIHPSRSEGLSASVIEAMANGRLVIMSDIQENLELIDHSGIAFPVDDRHALTRTLDWIVTDSEIVARRGERAREIVRQRYSWDVLVKRLEKAYRMAF